MTLVDIEHSCISKVLSGHRITLPKQWSEKWKVKEGDLVAIEEEPNSKHLKVYPVIAVEQNTKEASG